MNRLTRRGLLAAILIAASMHVIVGAQGGGQNINVITGSGNQFTGDLFRQRQNESVIGISSINPANILIAYNDYRTVDVADDFGVGTVAPTQGFVARLLNFFRAPWRLGGDGMPPKELKTAAHAWIGLSFSNNGGRTFYTGLLPGRYSQVPPGTHPSLDDTPRLAEFDAASDPVMATTPDQFFLGGIAFNPPGAGSNGKSIGFVARFTDRNNAEQGQTLHYDGMKILPGLETSGAETFVDKPQVAAGPNGHVYAAFVMFDTADVNKLSSKILFFRSADYGETWLGPVVVSDPLTRNQAPWILVDPRNEEIVYIGWRVFTAPKGKLSNAIVGRKSFNGGASFVPSTPYTVMASLRAFDQPQGNLSAGTPPVPRSNAYPTATIDGNGALHVAIQEYVYPHTANQNQRGRPLNQNTSVTQGVPRIVLSSSYNGGVSWTQRKAADLGTAIEAAGTQFMPVLTAAGEPGPSCPGSTGPLSRVMVMYYDARASGWGAAPGTQGYVIGGGAQFDVRIAQASACSTSGLTFSPSQQLSQYTRSSTPDADSGQFPIVPVDGEKHLASTVDPANYPAVNRSLTMFCGGNCAFTGDYMSLSPRVPYVKTATGWKLTTAVMDPTDRERLPAPVVQGAWADTRDALFPGTGNLRSPAPAGSTGVDELPWNVYQPPGTGLVACENAGSRDQNIYTAEYTPGGLYASAPTTFRTSSIARSYPLYVENRTPETKYFRVTIDQASNASFDFTDFDGPGPPQHPNFGEPYARVTNLVIGPISSVTGTVVVGPGATEPINITVEETNAPVEDEDGNTTAGGEVIPPPTGATTSVRLLTAGVDTSTTETYQPGVHPTAIVTKPFATSGLLPLNVDPAPAAIPSPTPFSPNPVEPTPFSPNPFSPNPFSPNPFSPNPFSPNPFSPNPFSPNPFSPNPFSPNTYPEGAIVYDVTDVNYVVKNEGEQTAAFNAIATLQAANDPTKHVYQLLINRAVPTPILIRNADGTCRAADSWTAVPISTIASPFSPNPFSPNPFSPNPFSPNPFSPNPFSPNPFPSEFSNATFYVKPTDGAAPSAGYAAPPTDDFIVITFRDFTIVPRDLNDPSTAPLSPNDLEVVIEGQVPEQPVLGGGFEATPPSAGTGLPHHLEFVNQPANGTAMVPLQPVTVAARDAFGGPVSSNASSGIPVTMALGSNPSEAVLAGTTTKQTIDGVAGFDDLTINLPGQGFTLVASSPGLGSATSVPFSVAAEPLVILTGAVPDATHNEPYSQNAFAKGGVQPYVWDIELIPDPDNPTGPPLTEFSLPDGLALTAGGLIAGTPTMLGQVRSFRLRVTDAAGQTATQDLCIHVLPSSAGTLTTAAATPLQLALALAGEGVEVIESSVTFTGNDGSRGTFSGGFGATGIDAGIVLSSGAAANIQPPNNSDGITGSAGGITDADLQTLIPNTVTEAAVLEFDFKVTDPDATSVKFEYVFASDEYNEFVNSNFNDVFGFFLSGPDFPKRNLAIVPGTENLAVSINNVNLGLNSEFYVNNDFHPGGPFPRDTQADGLTVVLTIQADIVPHTVYRMKIAVGDAGDTSLDSWVLLRAGSFSAICPIIPGGQ